MKVDEFNKLNGTPKGGFRTDENSLTQKILRGMRKGEAFSAAEVAKIVGEDASKVKATLTNMARSIKKKDGTVVKGKVIVKYDANHVGWFALAT